MSAPQSERLVWSVKLAMDHLAPDEEPIEYSVAAASAEEAARKALALARERGLEPGYTVNSVAFELEIDA